MKKRAFLFLMIGLLFLCSTGCEKKKNTPTKEKYKKPTTIQTAENGEKYKLDLNDQRYVVLESLNNDIYLKDIILNKDKSAYRNDCTDEYNCDSYKGTYYFQEDTIIINYHEKSHTEEDWTALENDISIKYTITKDNEFKDDNTVYVIEK